eukprot:4752815-Pleurochrysis_carterae.AAC.3
MDILCKFSADRWRLGADVKSPRPLRRAPARLVASALRAHTLLAEEASELAVNLQQGQERTRTLAQAQAQGQRRGA